MKTLTKKFEELLDDRDELTLAEAEFMEKHPIIGWGGFLFKWFSIWVTVAAIVRIVTGKFQEENI